MLANNDSIYMRDFASLSMDEMLKSISKSLTTQKKFESKFLESETVEGETDDGKNIPVLFNKILLSSFIDNASDIYYREAMVDAWSNAGIIKKGTPSDDDIALLLTEYRVGRLNNDPVLEVIEQLLRLFVEEGDSEKKNPPFLLDPLMFSVIKSVYSDKTKKIPKNFELFKDCLLLSLKAFKEGYYDIYLGYINRSMNDEDRLTDEEQDDVER